MPPKPKGVAKRQRRTKNVFKTSRQLHIQNTLTPAATAVDDKTRPIFFWKPHEFSTGYLSQWYAQPFRGRNTPIIITSLSTDITIPNNNSDIIYPTAEHFMMHQKAVLFGDSAMALEILSAKSPRQVKALGRKVQNFDPVVWEAAREIIVVEGNWCKFSLPVVSPDQEPENLEEREGGERIWQLGNDPDAEQYKGKSFREVLLATGDRELVEASPMDRIWGVGFGAQNAPANREKWGLNLLGKCLMEVREQFRREDEEARKKGEMEIDNGEGEAL
ncbi:hypothetical protein F4777DRAFT_553029 [Nemania sp. FL0916]|nr:hypothetical protein F4777DRAFT_553029 [Nemania sp. FL0916]